VLLRILVAMDTAGQRRRLKQVVSLSGTIPMEARSRRDLWAQLTHVDVDIVLCGQSLLPTPPEPLVASIRELPEHPDVVVVSNREDAIERAGLLAAGCMAVLYEGLPDDKLVETLSALINRRRNATVHERHAGLPGMDRSHLTDFVSESASMRDFMTVARRVVESQSPLLILGETGVGKERLARALHADGPRASGPFVPVNCGALPEGLLETELFGHELGAFTGATRSRRGFFELAHGGSLFLDEIGELALHLQVKLLRVLEERSVRRVGSESPLPIDVRIMAATNRQLEAEVSAKQFRADLYYRLAVVTLVVPPLRERHEDIPDIVESYLVHFRTQIGRPVLNVSPEAMNRLVNHSWPGNVRELINVIERAVILAQTDTIHLADLPPAIARPGRGRFTRGRHVTPGSPVGLFPGTDLADMPLKDARRQAATEFEYAYMTELLSRTRGRIGETARLARVDERTIHALMKKHKLRKESFKQSAH